MVLVEPMYDVLEYINHTMNKRHPVVRRMLREMYRYRTSLWGWTKEQWIDILINPNEYNTRSVRLSHHGSHSVYAISYLLGHFSEFYYIGLIRLREFSSRIFGTERVDMVIKTVIDQLLTWGYNERGNVVDKTKTPNVICAVLLFNRSPYLEDLTLETLKDFREACISATAKQFLVTFSKVLVAHKIIPTPLERLPLRSNEKIQQAALATVHPEWQQWSERWRNHSTLSPASRRGTYRLLMQTGRWLLRKHSDITRPDQWTRELAAEYVAAIDHSDLDRLVVHADGSFEVVSTQKPLKPRAKASILDSIQRFFRDCQEWKWIPYRFDPLRAFAIPSTIQALIGPDPKVIADDIWLKLLWAGLNLTEQDLIKPESTGFYIYPLEMVRAVAIVWLFAGLRSDEIHRLRLGCVRWQREDITIPGTDEVLPKDAVCMLDIPVNKTQTAFTKPVDRVVGEAIAAWERIRPVQPPLLDPKTNELVHYLFAVRGRTTGNSYINQSVIPILCRKAGVPTEDARGNITSHRARSTIATRLASAKEPMTMFELKAWLGHRSIQSTQHYMQVTPTQLAKAFVDADYFGRHMRTIDVLIDQEAIKNGEAAAGLPWKYYDLGHGYCSYDFFEQCEHRMACAQCVFYRPKSTFLPMLLEKKAHLIYMKQEVPLTDLELATVEGDIEATERLIAQLVDTPTPEGPTPRELFGRNRQHTQED
jgi:integrase